MLKDFREFALKGNMVDMAVGIIIGAAFVGVVQSLVNDIIMPPIGLLLGHVDFSNLFIVLRQGARPGPYPTPIIAKALGAVTWNYGVFINTVISFLIVAFTVFLVVRQVNNLRRQAPPASKPCPYCLSVIPIDATRCAHCTSQLPPSGPSRESTI